MPDGAIDPFRLTTANVMDARNHGADILTYHEVTDLLMESGRVSGVELREQRTGQKFKVRSSLVINAGGIWGSVYARWPA